MRIAVMTDVHANLPALQAALRDIGEQGCEEIYHTGDAIGIAVAYNVFRSVACGEKTARLWFAEEAMTGRTRSISPSSNKECRCRTNERTPGIPLARLSGADCGLAMRRD